VNALIFICLNVRQLRIFMRYTPFFNSMKFVVTIASLFLFACSSNTSKLKEDKAGYYPTYTKELEDTTRTLDLTYIAWACQCANWATEADIKKSQDDGDKLADKSIFIEPADNALELPDTLGYSGDLIKFTGQFYKDKGYPKKYLKIEMQVDKAKVLRYTKYQVLRSNYRDFVSDTATKATH